MQAGSGRHAGGEQMEWIWARGKPLFLLARYMAPARWWDTMNAFLAFLTRQLQVELPSVLHKRLGGIDKTIGEYHMLFQILYPCGASNAACDPAVAFLPAMSLLPLLLSL